jgi:hypothetical protein
MNAKEQIIDILQEYEQFTDAQAIQFRNTIKCLPQI